MPRLVVSFLTAVAAAAALTGAWSAPARAAEPQCARTTDPATPAEPGSGTPCWVDVVPYPFGADGTAVDTASPECRPGARPWAAQDSGDRVACYLTVTSFAFRAWNRGLAVTVPSTGADLNATTAFGVWIFNGARWYPDPTFPGQGVCRGTQVQWAGKRDYWLVGSRVGDWPRVCRFDGVNFEWQPLDLPQTTIDRIPRQPNGQRKPGALNTIACHAWNDCWLFGSFGMVVHWDGQSLTDASPDFRPWELGGFTSSVARVDEAGNPFGFAVTTSGGFVQGEQLLPQYDGSPPPQLYMSSGGRFAAQPLSPPTIARDGDQYRTDLVAVDFDARGNGWVAGDPVGYRPGNAVGTGSPGSTERRVITEEPAPLIRLGRDGAARRCAGTPPDRFTYSHAPIDKDVFLWSSISALPEGGAALVAGQQRPPAGSSLNDDGLLEPLIAQVSCDAAPRLTRFREPDPTSAAPAPALIPANRSGAVTAVTANAVNDAWAATTKGSVRPESDVTAASAQRPHLYRLTDTRAPLAPAGDDHEPRPLVFEADPTIFVEAPPDAEPVELPPVPAPPPAVPVAAKAIKLKAAIYAVRVKVRGAKRGRAKLVVTFRVRRPVSIGVQGLRRRKVVASSGVKRFTGKRGTLVLRLTRRRWPTRIRFVTPPPAPATTAPAAPGGAGVP